MAADKFSVKGYVVGRPRARQQLVLEPSIDGTRMAIGVHHSGKVPTTAFVFTLTRAEAWQVAKYLMWWLINH